MISIPEAKRLAKRTLSEKRYQHTLNVKKCAVKLAKKYGQSSEKAALAALLHDICKEMPKDKMLQILSANGIINDSIAQRPASVWHGLCAAALAKAEYGVQDEEILSASRCHTTGRVDMSQLDKIIYMADMTSEERTYPEVTILRKALQQSLDKATVQALGMSIAWLQEQGKTVDSATLDAYAALRAELYGGE